MKRTCLALLLLSCLCITVWAQEQPPELLREAAHCLAAKGHGGADWLNIRGSKVTELRLGYFVDTKSYPGDRVLYVVSYTGTQRSEGFVFTILLDRHGRRHNFHIQNNAKFVRSKDGIAGINFVEPPLGGIWTQQHLVAAIKKIGRKPSFTVPVRELLAPSALVRCSSYADKLE